MKTYAICVKSMFAMCLPSVNKFKAIPVKIRCIKKVFLFYEFIAMRSPVILLRLTVLYVLLGFFMQKCSD